MNKAKRNKIIISILLIAIVSTIAMIVYFAQDWSANKSIKGIDITGNILLDKEEILLKVKPLVINHRKDEIDLIAISNSLRKNEYIKEVYLSTASSEKIGIEIIERTPLAYLVKDNGSLIYVDSDLCLFGYRHDMINPDIPIIRNILSEGIIDTVAISNAIEIVQSIRDISNEVFKNVSEIIYNDNSIAFEIIFTAIGKKVIFGNNNSIAEKVDKMKLILDLIEKEKSLQLSKYIDIRWNNQIVARS